MKVGPRASAIRRLPESFLLYKTPRELMNHIREIVSESHNKYLLCRVDELELLLTEQGVFGPPSEKPSLEKRIEQLEEWREKLSGVLR